LKKLLPFCRGTKSVKHCATSANLLRLNAYAGRESKETNKESKRLASCNAMILGAEAIIDVRFEGDVVQFMLREDWYDCPYCNTRNFFSVPTIKHGMILNCVECRKRVLVQGAFRLELIDNLKEIAEAAEAGHITDAQELEFLTIVGNRLAKKVNDSQKPTRTVQAINLLMGRLVESGNTLRVLFDHANDHKWVWDGASILRTSFDAMLQAMYILHDPVLSEELATRFLDFRVVEQVKMLRIFENRSTTISWRMAESPRRAEFEPQIMAEFDRVCTKYGYNPEKPRTNWYSGNLDTIAEKTGYKAEYEIVQKQLSSIVHSSVFGINGNDYLKSFHVTRFQWDFAFRVLGRYAAYAGVKLDANES
jgi:hypothetical protein